MSHPKVAIAPVTSSNRPYALKLGTKVLLTVTLETMAGNGRDYQLTGSNLSPECYTIGSMTMGEAEHQHDQIEVLIHPTQVAPIGGHQLQLQLQSANDDLIWEGIVYLQFMAADEIEIALSPDLILVEDGVGLYELLITNTSEVERVLTLHPQGLSPRKGCIYTTEPSQLTLGPGDSEKAELMAQPQRWWFRPWFGKGRQFQFQVDLQDTDGTSLPQMLAQGKLVWQPYSRPQSFKFLMLLLVALATSSALLWQILFRKPVPTIATLKSSQAMASTTGQKDIQLSWTIKNGQKLSKLVLWRESQGKSEVAQTFLFTNGIPKDLQRSQPKQTANFCEYQQSQSDILACQSVSTQTVGAGDYNFKLQAFSTRSDQPADSETTPVVAFVPNQIPEIVKFLVPGRPSSSAQGPVASAAPIPSPVSLNWEISNPRLLTELQVRAIHANNAKAARIQRYRFQDGKLPAALTKYCSLGEKKLTCQNVPTASQKKGQYLFQMNASYQQDQQSFTSSEQIGPLNVEASPLKIARFLVNGQNAPAKFTLPTGQNKLKLAWQVLGGDNPIVTMVPGPGEIPTSGSATVEVDPLQQGVITLQASDSQGKRVLQMVEIEGSLASTTVPNVASLTAPRPQPIPQAAPQSTSTPQLLEPQLPKSQLPLVWPSLPLPSSQPSSPPPAPETVQVAAASSPKPQYSPKTFEEAQAVTRGLVIARREGAVILSGSTWKKTQDAITLLRRGHSREQAAQKAGVPLWKLNVLTDLGQKEP